MKIGFGDLDLNTPLPSDAQGRQLRREEVLFSYDGTWLGRSCGARWAPLGSNQPHNGILVEPGSTRPPVSNAKEETVVLVTKNGTITINSIKSYA